MAENFWRHRYISPIPFPHTQDPVVDRVIDLFIKRSDEGMIKYQTTMEDNPAAKLEWINHAQQEAMDFILYLERLKKEV